MSTILVALDQVSYVDGSGCVHNQSNPMGVNDPKGLSTMP